jgi:2,5-diamino-6-(ribosylamino)-4(3H)-pyrimidinone 5'-phosphate reductase
MKPYLICHMVTTIDGRIMADRWGKVAGKEGSGDLFEKTAASFGIGAWIVGTTTMKEFCDRPFKLKRPARKVERKDHVVKPLAKTLAIGVDRKGQTFWKKDEVEGDHVVLLVTQSVSDGWLAHLQEAGVSYLFCGEHEVDLRVAMDKLARAFKLKKAMVQGGGAMNGSFLKDGLLDEISHLTVPVADGGVGIQTMFDIPGKAPAKAAGKLKVISRKAMEGGVSWTRYKVV